jgi:hypothetical protein
LWTFLRDGRVTLGEVMTDVFGGDEDVKLALAARAAAIWLGLTVRDGFHGEVLRR